MTSDGAEFAEELGPIVAVLVTGCGLRIVLTRGPVALAMSRHPASIDSLAYVAGDLVTDRVQLLGKIVGSNGVPGLLTEQNHVIAYPCRGTWPQINHELVHADPPDHWPELTADEYVATIRQSSGVPVGVTHRDC